MGCAMKTGNYMRKSRINVSISRMGQEIAAKLSEDEGVSVSDVLERILRKEHDEIYGRENRPKLRPVVK